MGNKPTESSYFRFAANRKRKRQTSVCFLQTEIGSLFSLIGKHSHLWVVNVVFAYVSKYAYVRVRGIKMVWLRGEGFKDG